MKFEKGYALIIGIANYPDVRKLPETVLKDARDIHGVLKSDSCGYSGDHLRLLLDQEATGVNIRQGLDWLCKVTTSGDTAVVYLSSHGGRIENDSQEVNYLLPYDCQSKRLKETAISGNELTAMIQQIRARRLLLLFDFCFSGGAGDPKTLQTDIPGYKAGYLSTYYDALAEGQGRVIMASSRADEVSMILPGMANSLFTRYLLEALQGNAYSRGDGLIRVFDIFHYVSDQVKAQYSQHPVFKAADLEDNFPISLSLGGKGSLSRYQPEPSSVKEINKTELREFILQYFSLEDLQILCTDIHENMLRDQISLLVNLDMVGGGSFPVKVQNLIDYLNRRGYLNYLVECIRMSRPGISTTIF
jgi:metacaspase-1